MFKLGIQRVEDYIKKYGSDAPYHVYGVTGIWGYASKESAMKYAKPGDRVFLRKRSGEVVELARS